MNTWQEFQSLQYVPEHWKPTHPRFAPDYAPAEDENRLAAGSPVHVVVTQGSHLHTTIAGIINKETVTVTLALDDQRWTLQCSYDATARMPSSWHWPQDCKKT